MFKWLHSLLGESNNNSGDAHNALSCSETVNTPPDKRRLPKGPDSCYLDPRKCYRCGKPSVDGCFEAVHLYKDVRVGKRYPEVEFDRYLLKMPLCADCNGHEVEHSWGFALYLQEKGYNSWHIGIGPSKSEIESVWHLHKHPPRDIWGEALERQKREAEECRIKESHVKDKTIAIIDQYEILQKLGEGGFGAVCLARDTVSKTLVAIKGLPNKVSDEGKYKEELRRNFALIAHLHHPNIASPLVLHSASKVVYFDSDIEKFLRIHVGDMFFVMEFVRGETLMEWRVKLYKSALLDSAVQIVSKVASALDFAHDKGILHRDIKPGNIIVYWNRDKQSIDVKVLDFGLASAMKEVFQRLECHPNEMAGTLPYMAPEQWRMEKLGVGTDIYALAVVAHQFVFYTIPNEDVFKSGNLSAMYRRVCEEDVKFADKIWPEMKRVLERGMAKKVRDRYFSCCEFAQDFATAIKAFPAPLTKNLDVDWRKEGNVLKHPLVKRLSELNFQCHHIDHLISGFVGDYEMDKFWNYLAILIRNITPYRLTHANEVLSLDFSVDKNKEEQVVSDVAEKVRADIASRYLEWAREEKFRAAWSSLIDWAKLMGEVLVTYPWDSEGVLECMKALKVQIDKLEEKERMKNVTIGGKTFIGNPFYRKKLTPEIILCDYYIEMGSR